MTATGLALRQKAENQRKMHKACTAKTRNVISNQRDGAVVAGKRQIIVQPVPFMAYVAHFRMNLILKLLEIDLAQPCEPIISKKREKTHFKTSTAKPGMSCGINQIAQTLESGLLILKDIPGLGVAVFFALTQAAATAISEHGRVSPAGWGPHGKSRSGAGG